MGVVLFCEFPDLKKCERLAIVCIVRDWTRDVSSWQTKHTSCSPLVFDAEYTFQALGSLYASATASSFHEFSSMVNFLFGFGIVAAVDDDVMTNRVTVFSLLAASSIL